MNIRTEKWVFFAVATALWGGCEGIPVQTLENAKRGVEAAKSAEAERYAAEEFAQLQDSLRAGLVEIDRQSIQFSLFRNYTAAKTTLVWVDNKADEILEKVEESRENNRRTASYSVELATAAIDAAAALVTKIPRRQDSAEEIRTFKDKLKELRSSLQEVIGQLGKENFSEAQVATKAIQVQAEQIQRQARSVLARYRISTR